MAKISDKLKKSKTSAEDDGLDILTEVKEPFSFSNFFQTHIVDKAKQIKNTLADKGILFFLFSPFQARGRLIAQMFILCIGILFGVIPRASSMVNAIQDQAYASELAGLDPKTVGSISITPAASSNYKSMHMLAFVIKGENLPSDASKYEVHMAQSYGSSDWADVTYSWTIYPVTDNERILLVSVDQTKQASRYGAFNLYVQLEGDEVPDYAMTPYEITLSPAQDTTDLYDKTGIHLSALTESICGKGSIATKQEDFIESLDKYHIALEQAEAMPIDIKVSPTRDTLEAYCIANRIYRTLDDYSTTEDILKIEQINEPPVIDYDVVLNSSGIEYDEDFIKELKENNTNTDEDIILFNAFDSVNTAKNDVISAMNSVNNAAMSWYSTLTSYKLILNQTVKQDSFLLTARCTETITDDIMFVDNEPAEPYSEEESGLSGTIIGDEPYTKPAAPVIPEPDVPEEPVSEEPVVISSVEEESSEEESSVVPSSEVSVVQESSEAESSEAEPSSKAEEVKPEKPSSPVTKPASVVTSGDPADSK